MLPLVKNEVESAMPKSAKNLRIEQEGEELVLDKEEIKEPHKYTVVFYNDDFTTQEFVVHVLMNFFFKNATEAFALMLQVHQEGRAKVGLYPKDVALSKVALVTSFSRQNGMPLMVKAESVGG